MRSWFVGMPGEYVSCVGCHEKQNSTAAPHARVGRSQSGGGAHALARSQTRVFLRSRSPAPCSTSSAWAVTTAGAGRPNFADTAIVKTSGGISDLPKSYLELHPFVRRNGPEGDYHTLTPLEFHANTSLLVQMLRKGHHNVKLDAEAWDRLITWIDINVPAYGTFSEIAKIPSNFEKRRYECKVKYANVAEDIEAIPDLPRPTRRVRATRARTRAARPRDGIGLAVRPREGSRDAGGPGLLRTVPGSRRWGHDDAAPHPGG